MVDRLYSPDDIYICVVYYKELLVHVVKEWQGTTNLPPEKPKTKTIKF